MVELHRTARTGRAQTLCKVAQTWQVTVVRDAQLALPHVAGRCDERGGRHHQPELPAPEP